MNFWMGLVAAGGFCALPGWGQPTAPSTPDAPCSPIPAGAAINDTVPSVPDAEGFYNLFDGSSFKGWWNSCLTGHSGGSSQGAVFRVDPEKKAIYSTQRGGTGGVLMTRHKFTNYEIVFDFWPDFDNDGGLFNRTTADGNCYQTVLDYIGGGSLLGSWGEGGFTSMDYRPFSFQDTENDVSIPGNGNGESSNWTKITAKLNPAAYGCPATGCVQADWRRLWDANDWNQVTIKFYGGAAANTGNIHMKSYFRKIGAAAWVPVVADTILKQVVPAGYIGLQVHGGGRFNGKNGTWYRNMKWRPLNDKGEPLAPVVAARPLAAKTGPEFRIGSGYLFGKIDSDHEILVRDMRGRTVERFSGKAGTFSYPFTSPVHGWLTLKVKTAGGWSSQRVFRAGE